MDNREIEECGIAAVKEYEKKAGRSVCKRVCKCGYDLITKKVDGTDERHIEVKSTSKDRFTFRWFEELENEASRKDGFFLYLVTNAGTDAQRVFEYDREKLNKRFSEAITHYVYVFPKSDFQ